MDGILVLEDGTFFEGVSIGASGERSGEVVLQTAVVGYQEIMTDPANAGKIIVFTYPLIGNYGIAKKFNESSRCWIEALVMKEESRIHSNWQAEESLGSFLQKENVSAMSNVDTRTLAVKIRDHGQMFGLITNQKEAKNDAIKRLKELKKNTRKDFIKEISVKEITEISKNPSGTKIAILDLGCLQSFIQQLKTLGCSLTLVPYNTPAEKILGMNPDGLIISNGPEDDEAIPAVTATIKEILGKIPLLGISAGHEIIALALGGKVKKMPLGHHGVNYPVKTASSFKGEITVQNHNYIVDESSIESNKNVTITLRNVNDHTIEEMESTALKFISTQYYPASPGFDETHIVFNKFIELVKKEKGQ